MVKIEEGGYYKDAKGRIVGPIEKDAETVEIKNNRRLHPPAGCLPEGDYPWKFKGKSYTNSGEIYGPHQPSKNDLVERVYVYTEAEHQAAQAALIAAKINERRKITKAAESNAVDDTYAATLREESQDPEVTYVGVATMLREAFASVANDFNKTAEQNRK